MTPALRSLEWSSRTAPLGLRFWDRTSARLIGDGLEITAWPADAPALRATAVPNTSGGWVLASLPLLGGSMRRSDDSDPWNPAPAQRAYRVEVTDALRRFQPFSFAVRAPHQGFLAWQCNEDASPPIAAPLDAIPLFSSPVRPTPITLAALRSQLIDAATGEPAAWALLEVSAPGQPAYRGIADDQGRVAVLFAYPEASAVGAGPSLSPIGPADPPLTDQTWTLGLRVHYTPRPPGDVSPDLCTTLSQAPASLWEDSNRTSALTSATLRYGRELIVRSTDTSGRPMSVALVTTP